MINHTMVLTVHGTRRSERGGGLDNHEISTITNNPGEYTEDIQTAQDLIEKVTEAAYRRGEWISSFKIDDRDIVAEYAVKVLQENMLSIDESAIELSRVGLFAAADLDSLTSFLLSIKIRHFSP